MTSSNHHNQHHNTPTEEGDADQKQESSSLSNPPSTPDPSRGLSQTEFDVLYGRSHPSSLSCCQHCSRYCHTHCRCTRVCCVKGLVSQFPIVDKVRHYKFKDFILGDLISGLSLGVMNIPQSLGYALLATVPPIHGMYTAFFAPLIYVIFGTSNHIAMGVMALSSLLIADVIKKQTLGLHQLLEESSTSGNETEQLIGRLQQETVDIAALVTLLSGVVSVLMGVCRLGFLTDYMGDAFVSGWLTAANIRVITSQVIQLLQLQLPTHIGAFNYFYTVYDIITHITETNVASVVIAMVAFILLLPVKYGINVRFRSRLKVPIPIDLIVVTIAILACYFGDLGHRYGVRQVSHIPTGLPIPRIPPLQRSLDVMLDAVLLALVGYVLGYMMVKLFSDKYNYPVSADQELKAMGMCNVVGGCFSAIAASTSPPRCFFMEQTGGRSQLANVLSSLLTLMFLYFAGPVLEPMPICVLNVLIISACIPIFEYYKRSVIFWRSNKYDFAIWTVSMLSTICLDINKGIIIGIGFSLLTVVFRTQRPQIASLSPVDGSHVLVDGKKYTTNLAPVSGVKIFHFSSPLYFATLDLFKKRLFEMTVNPSEVKAIEMGMAAAEELKEISANQNGDMTTVEVGLDTPLTTRKVKHNSHSEETIKLIVIDCSAISFMDTSGAKLLSQLRVAYSNVGVTLVLAGCNEQTKGQLKSTRESKEMAEQVVYPSVSDAVKCNSR